MKLKWLCLHNKNSKFNNIWRDLNETTRQMTQQQQQREDMLQSQMMGGQAIVNHPRSMFAEWIAGKPAEHWALLHDKEGARFVQQSIRSDVIFLTNVFTRIVIPFIF